MGKIFGISDLPVTTFMTPFESVRIAAPQRYINQIRIGENTKDLYVFPNAKHQKRGLFFNIISCVRRLMRANVKKEIH